MVSKDLFTLHWTAWGDRWAKTAPREDVTAKLFYEVVSEAMDDDQFEAASKALFRDNEFFPTPKQVIEAGGGGEGDLEVQAVAEWTGALKSSSWASNGRQSVNRYPFSDRGQFAWDSLGGAARVGNAEERDLDFLRREFVRRYVAATPDSLERVERTLPGRCDPRLTSGDVIGAIESPARKALGE